MSFSGKTPVSVLQELMASRNLPLPTYHEKEVLDPALLVQFRCTVNAGGVTAVGFGSNKKAAKQESAKNALIRLNQKLPAVSAVIFKIQQPPINYVGDLNEYSSKNGLSYPVYDLIPGAPGGLWTYNCHFLGNNAVGSGANKKEAKQDAAKNMLMLIQTNSFVNKHSKIKIQVEDIDQVIAKYNALTKASASTVPAETATPRKAVDYLSEKLKYSGIEYFINEMQTSPYYILSLSVKGTPHKFLETGVTKEQALEKALKKILLIKETGNLFNDLINL